jgi:hypothetical protein
MSAVSSNQPLFLTRVASFVAVGVVLGYVLMAIPNVELITATCFTAGYCLGPLGGIFVGALTEFLFAGFHPTGSSFGLLLIAQMLGMVFVGFAGSRLSIYIENPQKAASRRLLFLAGLLLTFVFDVLTNIAFPVQAGFSLYQTLVTLIAGIGFSVVHFISNALIFSIVLPPLLARFEKMI